MNTYIQQLLPAIKYRVVGIVLVIIWALAGVMPSSLLAQEPPISVSFINYYVPQFTANSAPATAVNAIGIRAGGSPEGAYYEANIHFLANYGERADFSYGLGVAYVINPEQILQLKIGLEASRIHLSNYEINPSDFEPEVGDITYNNGAGTQFRPYIESEWLFSASASIFVQAGYQIMNSERTIITDVESFPDDSPDGVGYDPTYSDDFKYSANGFGLMMGLGFGF